MYYYITFLPTTLADMKTVFLSFLAPITELNIASKKKKLRQNVWKQAIFTQTPMYSKLIVSSW